MSENETADSENPASRFPVIRQITAGAIPGWPNAGWQHFRRGGRASLFYGACFAGAGWLIQAVFSNAYVLFAGLTIALLPFCLLYTSRCV